MRAVVAYNTRSGSALPEKQIRTLLTNANISVEKFIDITDSFEKSILPYLKRKSVIIIGYGGDGTLNSVASMIVGKNALFAPLPGGTLNHFTKDLGISQNIEDAIAQLPTAKKQPIDTATVNGKLFLNNSSIGLYPSSLADRSRIESKLGKWPAAIYASIRAFVRFRLYRVSIDGKSYTTPFIFVGNNHYDADSLMARKSIDSGLLSVHLINSNKRRSLVKIILLALIGRSREADEFTSFETEKLTITINRRNARVSFDGEHQKFATPIVYKIQRKSLIVLK